MGRVSGIVLRWRKILPEADDEAQENDACLIMSAKRSVKSGHGDHGGPAVSGNVEEEVATRGTRRGSGAMSKLSERFARRAAERRVQSDRRHRPFGGRRRTDRGRPWWQKGLFFAGLCVALRCWQVFRRTTPRGE